jgi:Aspartyl protease
MALTFPYLRRPTRRPIYPLGGVLYRYLPIVSVILGGPRISLARDGLLDTGATDTVCPEALAALLGVDLSHAPEGDSQGVGGQVLRVRYATVTLRVTDAKESCVWDAIIGFAPIARRQIILGQTGFLQYFDVTLLNPFREIILEPNASFAGQHLIH